MRRGLRAAARAGFAAGGIAVGVLLIAMPFTKPMPAGAAILCVFIGGVLFVRSLLSARR